MIKKFTLLLAVLFVGILSSQHKFLVNPKLSDEDLQSTKSKIQADAPAEILHRSVHFMIDYNGYLTQEIITRIKIYDKDNADDYLNHQIAVYDNGSGSREILSNLKANTYNYEDGKSVTTKIDRDEKFKSKEDKNYTITKFAFANVKNGSVVEYSYKLYSPFLGSTPRILIEEEIPVKYVEYVFDTPKPLGYSINYKGSVVPTHRDSGERTMYGNEYQTYRFGYENLPAYKEEKYVLNSDNYKTGIKAELNSTYIGNEFKSYSLSWKDIQKRLYEHDDFGGQLKKQNLVKSILPGDITSLTVKMDKARAILNFVQDNYTYNKEDEVFTDKGIKNLLSTKIGNTAEINLLLTMLLRSANIEADPVVISTVRRGTLLAYLPSITQLNYVVASFTEGGKIFLMDGTSKQTDINMLPPKALNFYGIIMSKDDAKQITVGFPEISKTVLTVDAKMKVDGTFEGHFSDVDTKLYAMVVNEDYVEDSQKFSKVYKDEYKFPISELKHGIKDNKDFETSFDFTSDTFVDAIGNKLVFNPLLFLYSQKHSFDQVEPRKAPLEFYSAYDRIKKVSITLPDNYEFENVPKSKKFRTEDNSIQYTYLVTQEANKLTMETIVQVNDFLFPKEFYPAFKQIYDNITKMEGQVVTAVKKK